MLPAILGFDVEPAMNDRALTHFKSRMRALARRTDLMFAVLMVLQWISGIAIAIWVSPRTWAGSTSEVHVHVWGAVLLGGAITSLPVYLAIVRPAHRSTRYVIAVAQMLWSALLIHLTGGRIETHFHVFGSLAFLAFYRDWRVLIPATIVVLADHLLRGIFWPESVFGVLTAGVWRAFEHAGWVAFELLFLSWSCRTSMLEMKVSSVQQAELEQTNETIELEVERRTKSLRESEKRERDNASSLVQANSRLAEQAENLEAAAEVLNDRNTELADRTRQLEEQAVQLERQKEELGEFTYVASHDLQEPLRKLISFSSLLEEDVGGELPEAARTDLEFIVDAAHRMQMLVQDLLALSRAGRAAMKDDRVDLSTCVQRARDSLATLIEETGAEITCESLPDVRGDATLLTQLFQNLIGNALKFMEEGTAPRVTITASKDESGWTFGVRDNGIGMDPKYAQQIFAPFKRLHGRGAYAGTGIGLAICRKAVERHGGKIRVESALGEGACFLFTLGEVFEPEPVAS